MAEILSFNQRKILLVGMQLSKSTNLVNLNFKKQNIIKSALFFIS